MEENRCLKYWVWSPALSQSSLTPANQSVRRPERSRSPTADRAWFGLLELWPGENCNEPDLDGHDRIIAHRKKTMQVRRGYLLPHWLRRREVEDTSQLASN